MCAKLCIKNVYSSSFFLFWVLPTPDSEAPEPIFTHDRRVSAQGCAFSLLEDQNLTLKPSYSGKPSSLGLLLTGLEILRQKTALQ